MSTCCLEGFLAIETRLQALDRGAGQHQSLMLQNVVDVGPDRRQQVDLAKVRRGHCEAGVESVAVDDERRLAETELAELLAERPGLGFLDVEILHHDEL